MDNGRDSNSASLLWTYIDKYLRAGFALVELHSIEVNASGETMCTCGLPAGELDEHWSTAGKHPVRGKWQQQPLRSESAARAAFTGHSWNVGIVTGAASGLWVLDVDPGNGGYQTLGELERTHGPLPETLTVRTGGDGRQLYFRIPPGVVVRNSASKRVGRGLDVRGDGGQVVAPPSVSAKGSYWIVSDAPIADPPTWLVELARVKDEPTSSRKLENSSTVIDVTAASGQLGNTSQFGNNVQAAGGIRYAARAVELECERLAIAPEGTRNDTAFAAACNLIEFANSPWSGIDRTQAWNRYIEYGQMCGLSVRELGECWSHATEKVGLGARVMPVLPTGAAVDMPGVAPVALLVPPFPPSGEPLSREHPLPFTPIGSTGQIGVIPDPGAADPVELLLGEFLDVEGLEGLAPLEPIIDGYLFRDSIGWLVGQPGSMKSFVALSMACSVAAGLPWMDHEVRQGFVWYMVAEGGHGMLPRVRAWQDRYHDGERLKPSEIKFLPRPVQAKGQEWDCLIEAARRTRPALIVLDTQARVTVGIEENSATEIGLFVHAAERLRAAAGSMVLIVHHLTKDGASGRGSGAMLGAAQTELMSVKERLGTRTLVKVVTNKQKDSPELPPLLLLAQPVSPVSESGGETFSAPAAGTAGSVVLVPALSGLAPEAAANAAIDELAESTLVLVGIFRSTFYEIPGGTKGEIKAEWSKRGKPLASFYRAFNDLAKRKLIAKITGTGSWVWGSATNSDELGHEKDPKIYGQKG